jgi:hypothetical protein
MKVRRILAVAALALTGGLGVSAAVAPAAVVAVSAHGAAPSHVYDG